MARQKLTGGTEAVLGGVLSGDFGDATLAAMTNLEIDNKIGNEREEEEEEVYGIFTGKPEFSTCGMNIWFAKQGYII